MDIDRVVLTRGKSRSSERAFRDGAATLVVQVPDPRMSSQHAHMQRDGRRFVVDDTGSRNGTRVNGARVRGRVPLGDKDIIEVGQTLFVYRAAMSAPLDTAPDADSWHTGPDTTFGTLDPSLQGEVLKLDRIAASTIPFPVRRPGILTAPGAAATRVAARSFGDVMVEFERGPLSAVRSATGCGKS